MATHLPFVRAHRRGPLGTLSGQVARPNSVWRELGEAAASVVMFRGPQAYVSPGWYPGKAQHGRVVPTWDYVVAHVHGVARVIEGREATLDMLHRLTEAQEGRRALPWRVADAPAAFVDRLMQAIVGIEIPIDRLEGRLKASQDEAMADRLGTVRGLREEGTEEAAQVADLVQQAIESEVGRAG